MTADEDTEPAWGHSTRRQHSAPPTDHDGWRRLTIDWGKGPAPLTDHVDLGDVNLDDMLVITLGDEQHEFTVADIVGRLDTCFRCNEEIRSQLEIAWIGDGERSDCTESEDGAPHEPEEPT